MNVTIQRSAKLRLIVPTTATPKAGKATEAMTALSFRALCDVIEAHIEAMPVDQVDPARLEDLANKLGRIAHMAGRGA
jgi:hypothetical protein